jgi:hypothetical protein
MLYYSTGCSRTGWLACPATACGSASTKRRPAWCRRWRLHTLAYVCLPNICEHRPATQKHETYNTAIDNRCKQHCCRVQTERVTNTPPFSRIQQCEHAEVHFLHGKTGPLYSRCTGYNDVDSELQGICCQWWALLWQPPCSMTDAISSDTTEHAKHDSLTASCTLHQLPGQ